MRSNSNLSPINRGSFQVIVANVAARTTSLIVEATDEGVEVGSREVKRLTKKALGEFGLSMDDGKRSQAIFYSALDTVFYGGVI